MSETLLLIWLLALGWILLQSAGLRGWGSVPLGFIVGSLLYVASGFALVVLGSPTRPTLVLAVATFIVVVAAMAQEWKTSPTDLVAFIATSSLLIPVVGALRGANLTKYHIDSFRYLLSAGLLSDDSYGLATPNLLERRGLGTPLLQSLSGIYGDPHLIAHSPILHLSLLGALAWFAMATPGERTRRWKVIVIVVAMVAFTTNNRMVWNAFYLNDHLLVGSAFTVGIGSAWLLSDARTDKSPTRALGLLLALSLPTLVVSRPEGFILGGLVLLPLILDQRVLVAERRIATASLGYAMALWFGYVASRAALDSSGWPPLSMLVPAALGVILLVVATWFPVLRIDRFRRRPLIAVEFALWLSLAAFTLRDSAILYGSLRASYENFVGGAGSWGSSVIALGALTGLALAMGRQPALVQLRFPLTTLVPLVFLLPYLRGGAYRVGNGDSLNRMAMQFVPALVLYLAASALHEGHEAKLTDAPSKAEPEKSDAEDEA